MLDIKRARRARRCVGTCAWACPPRSLSSYREGFGDKLQTNVEDISVDGMCGDDQLSASDDLGGGAYDQAGIDAVQVIRVTSFPVPTMIPLRMPISACDGSSSVYCEE